MDRLSALNDVRLTLHAPKQREVSLVHDAPWEGNVCCYHTVFQDGPLYRMYYRGANWDKKATHPEVVCYAESDDGIVWRKPELGLVEFEGSKVNNIVWDQLGSHNFAPFRDANPACPPEQRYKALGNDGSAKAGLLAFVSSDAVRWRRLRPEPVITKGAFDSQNVAFWMPANSVTSPFSATSKRATPGTVCGRSKPASRKISSRGASRSG